MTLFNKIGKIGGIVQNVTKKPGEIVELTKINGNINTEEESIKQLYSEIGKHCFTKFEEGLESDEIILELCEKIKVHQENVNFFKEKINVIKKIVICPVCSNKMEKESAFCNKCGMKIEVKTAEIKGKNNNNNDEQTVVEQPAQE